MTDFARAASRPAAVRRLRWVLFGGAALWFTVAARLVQVQGLDHDRFAERARAQHVRQISLSARRGEILDREGRELAFDAASVSFYSRPAEVRDPDGVARHFARIAGRPVDVVRKLLDPGRPFVYLLRQADDADLVRARAVRFEGIFEQSEVRRLYPYGHLFGQLLGFTNIDNEGQEGVELALDELLAEQPGAARSFIDSRGRILPARSKATSPVRHGASVRLTVDAVIQGILEEELVRAVIETEAESALGIIADPRTGDILALGSVPLFDPNHPGASPAAHRRNRLVTDPFEPGSTLKPITMAAVLDGRHAPADTIVFCEQGVLVLATGDTLHDTKAHGWLTASEVLSRSSNIGMVKLARTLKRAELYEALRAFGFGTRTGTGLPAESAGLLHQARDWSERSLETIAIGQEISVTAVQLVQAFGAIANGGVLMAPRLLSEVRGADGELVRRAEPQRVRRVVSRETATRLQEMMRGVVRQGTGRKAAIAGVDVAGKTGTAQRAVPGGGGYAEDEYVSSFIGFLPATEARYICLVVIENPRIGKYGGTVAAPVFRRAMERVLALDGSLSPTAFEPALAAAAPTAATAIPDLRGLSSSRARVQAARRGLTLHLEGEGELVIAQIPGPHARRGAGDVIVCRLGEADDFPPPVSLRGTPLRQAVLMRKLGMRRQLAALVP
jgi:cell division protein FtsI/penicillin-binding protein 2